MSAKLSSKDIRKRIDHPVIDADGHWLEFGPSITDYLKEVGGQEVADAFRRRAGYVQKSLTMTPAERAQSRRAPGARRTKRPPGTAHYSLHSTASSHSAARAGESGKRA